MRKIFTTLKNLCYICNSLLDTNIWNIFYLIFCFAVCTCTVNLFVLLSKFSIIGTSFIPSTTKSSRYMLEYGDMFVYFCPLGYNTWGPKNYMFYFGDPFPSHVHMYSNYFPTNFSWWEFHAKFSFHILWMVDIFPFKASYGHINYCFKFPTC